MRSPKTKGRIDERMLFAYLALALIGVVMIYSISSIMAASRFGSSTFFFGRQLVWVGASLAAVWIILRFDLQRIAVWSIPAYAGCIILLVVVLAMPARNEAHRWIGLGPFTLQPSELFKFTAVFLLAFLYSRPRRDITDLRQLIVPALPLIGLGMILVLIEPDLGSTIVLTLTVAGMLFVAGARIKHLAAAAIPAASLGALVVFGLGYKKARVMDFIAAVADPLQGSYQSKQAALTLGAGGVFGAGLGDGRQKLFFLPYPHTDFIFAATGEEIGMLGLLVILGLFFYLLKRGMRIAAGQPDRFGYLLASGMVISLFINIAVNVAVVTSLVPVTGLPLPFLSYGGTSLLMSSAAVAVLLNLSKRAKAS